ncbi:Bcl-2-like protein [Monkeypox virus]|nr:Bcl-2-like protein [Monkeypox virus]WCF51448.1 Bcl-2-like protein [Monkeypox virus]WCF51627.1 Bcl-2-like protein [Monkeypox virus]WCF51806.1 Bcl-2-like protein [Monkeypox virus]WDO29005.1 Bcl-2-like protein [Monkeypox virus]
MASPCAQFSPCHCHATKDSLNTVTDVRHCLTEYILWVSHRWTHKESAGPLYRLLISFRIDAMELFGSELKEFSNSLPWDNIDNCVEIIKCFIRNDSMKTAKELCAIIGLCTQSAIVTGRVFNDKYIDILLMLRKILNENDYLTLLDHILTAKY